MRGAIAIGVLGIALCANRPVAGAPIILSSGKDTILVESDRLPAPAPTVMRTGWIRSPRSARTERLKDGRSLRLDDRTPAGTYETAEGALIEVLGPPRYPRAVSSGMLERVIYFEMSRSEPSTRFGMLVTSSDRAGTSAQFVAQMHVPHGGTSLIDEDTLRAVEMPKQELRRYALMVAPGRSSPLRVTWFAWEYESPPSYAWLGREPWPTATRIPIERADSRLRVIGAVIIDPRDGTVRRVAD